MNKQLIGEPCCGQYWNAHEEAKQVGTFYEDFTKVVNRRHIWLKDPTTEELDRCFDYLLGLKTRDNCEAVLIYYIGHGVEID